MSHEAPSLSSAASPEGSHSSHGAERQNGAERSPEQIAAREALAGNTHLQSLESVEVGRIVEQALANNAAIDMANKKADRSPKVFVEVGSTKLKAGLKSGRLELQEKAKSARQTKERLDTLEEKERARVKANSNPNAHTSRRSRRLARQSLRYEAKANTYEQKGAKLTNEIVGAVERKWEEDPKRQTEGYKTLRGDLASIDGRVEDRRQNRERFTNLSAKVQSGELNEDNEEYDALRQYFDAVGDETDEQYRNRLKNEAVKNYSDWSKDKDRKEKLAGFKNAENRLLTERLNVIDKANDPSTPIDEREKLLRQVSKWEGPDSLVEGDSGEFREWLRSNAQKEWVTAFQSADQNYQKKLQAIEQLSEEVKDRKKMVLEYTDRINGATTDEEKEVLKKEVADNHTKIGDLEEKIKTLPEQAREEFDKDLFRATETFHRRQRMEKLWQG